MPAYPGVANAVVPVASNISPIQLEKGESQYVFGVLAATATQLPVNDQNVALEAAPIGATGASITVNLQAGNEAQTPPMITVEIRFASAPGAGESIQIQEADTDADAFYITPAAPAYTVTVFTGLFIARVDLSPTGGKFMRVLRTKGANAVACTVKITRLA
jgi:hypothetical protein